MTTPQSGREAFEALVEAWRSEVERGTGYLNDESDRAILACADELEAALAQQGREVETVRDALWNIIDVCDNYVVVDPGSRLGEALEQAEAALAAIPGKTEVGK